ncbi:MAG: hypothetical protein RMA76_32020 [Deltaproteobacteria bacterium]
MNSLESTIAAIREAGLVARRSPEGGNCIVGGLRETLTPDGVQLAEYPFVISPDHDGWRLRTTHVGRGELETTHGTLSELLQALKVWSEERRRERMAPLGERASTWFVDPPLAEASVSMAFAPLEALGLLRSFDSDLIWLRQFSRFGGREPTVVLEPPNTAWTDVSEGESDVGPYIFGRICVDDLSDDQLLTFVTRSSFGVDSLIVAWGTSDVATGISDLRRVLEERRAAKRLPIEESLQRRFIRRVLAVEKSGGFIVTAVRGDTARFMLILTGASMIGTVLRSHGVSPISAIPRDEIGYRVSPIF